MAERARARWRLLAEDAAPPQSLAWLESGTTTGIMPLALGTREALCAHLGREAGDPDVGRLLREVCSAPQYRRTTAKAGAPRYALDGSVAGTVTEAEANDAAEALDGLRRRNAERAEAERARKAAGAAKTDGDRREAQGP